MRQEDIDLLEKEGWIVACESPFEIENDEYESKASGLAANIVLSFYKKQQKSIERIKKKTGQKD